MKLIVNILAICRKELSSYFASPLAYSIAGIFWLISGYFFVFILFEEGGILQEVAKREQMGLTLPPIDVPYIFFGDFFNIMGTLILFMLPLLSMGLYAEERRLGTLELLSTSPLSNLAVAIGKLLGVVIFFSTLIIPIVIYEMIILNATNPPFPPMIRLLAYLGLILLATAVLSLGMFISSLTQSNLIAALFTFALVLLLWIIDLIGNNLGGVFGQIIAHLSLLKHYDNFIRGIFSTSSLILLLSYIILGIFLTTKSIEALRYDR